MTEALIGVSLGGKELSEIANHFLFLLGFAVLMVAVGWLSYQRMLMVERRL